nr:NAD-dependent succinate-semialdehyde dehydrogenase [Sphingomonas sp. Y57]
MMLSINPSTGEEIGRYPHHTDTEMGGALDAARAAQASWRLQSPEDRTALLRALAALLRSRKQGLARLITLEMGKPITEAEAEIEKCAHTCDVYADQAPAWLGAVPVSAAIRDSAITFEPLGTVLAVMPWNYPFWQVFRFLAPALAAGNAGIVKHAVNVPQCAIAIEELVRNAGCPEGLFRCLRIDPPAVSKIIADDRIAAVTVTGSTRVGALIAEQAGRAIKKQVLELGGSDPFIVLGDADLEKAATAAVKARFTNVGQSCVNAKRFIVVEAVADRFVELFVAKASALHSGNPLDRAVAIGPLARADLRDALHRQVERTVAAGGKLLLGGTVPQGPGFFYPPTIVDHVSPDMAGFCEETFGPFAAIVRVADEEDALRLANQTEYGLAASLWTADAEHGRRLAARIDAGAVFVNAVVASDPLLPFGGTKRSGYGRELANFGMYEFVNIKTLCVEPA